MLRMVRMVTLLPISCQQPSPVLGTLATVVRMNHTMLDHELMNQTMVDHENHTKVDHEIPVQLQTTDIGAGEKSCKLIKLIKAGNW